MSGDLTVSGLLEVHTYTDLSDIDSDRVITASFLHLSIQMFLAAVHVSYMGERRCQKGGHSGS